MVEHEEMNLEEMKLVEVEETRLVENLEEQLWVKTGLDLRKE